MSFIAPNLSIIVGASTAAKIMGERNLLTAQCLQMYIIFTEDCFGDCPVSPVDAGIAGGLTNLSKMPACNLMLLGAQRRTLSGFSSTSLLPHTGFIYHCDVVQSLPPVSEYMSINCMNAFCSAWRLTVSFPPSGSQEEGSSSGGFKMHSGRKSGQFPWEFRWQGESLKGTPKFYKCLVY